jgi:hypothetical protein
LSRVRSSAGIAQLALNQIAPRRDGDALCHLHEVTLNTANTGRGLIWAARTLDPQGDPA